MGGAWKQLQVGQKVSLKELESGYQLVAAESGEPGQVLVEVNSQYVLLDNEEAGIQTRIPVHLLRAADAPQPAPLTTAA